MKTGRHFFSAITNRKSRTYKRVCCCSEESQQETGLHQQGHPQQRESHHYFHLLSNCQATSGMQCSALVFDTQKRYGQTGEDPQRAAKMTDGLGSPCYEKKLSELGFLSLEKKRLTETLPLCSSIYRVVYDSQNQIQA